MPHIENGTEVYTKREIFAGRGAGKGDLRRPRQVTNEEFDNNWARIFGKPRRPGRRHSIMDPVQYQLCPTCKHASRGDVCANCGNALPPQS